MATKQLCLAVCSAVVCIGASTTKSPDPYQSCKHLTYYDLHTTATIREVPPHPDLAAEDAIAKYTPILRQQYLNAPSRLVKRTYHGNGFWCPPGDGAPYLNGALQILVHGSSYTNEYWHSHAWHTGSLEYSWVDYARSQGYATLAIDRICNGNATHPDPLLECQLSTTVEFLHAMIQQQRKDEKVGDITLVGHSAGSITASNLVQAYPEDVEQLVLTGWPSGPIAASGAQMYYQEKNITAPPPPVYFPAYRSAHLADPVRFSGEGLEDQAYILSTNESARDLLYAGDFDTAIVRQDFLSRGSSPLGENTFTGMMSFPAYKGPVLVVTGDLDGAAWADRDVIWRTTRRFPSASKFEWLKVPNTGHSLNWHRSAPQTFKQVHQRLRQEDVGLFSSATP